MPLEPQYAKNIIVGVMFHAEWTWYISPPWLWILDLEHYAEAHGLEELGIGPGNISIDRKVTIVNDDTAPSFLAAMKRYKVSSDYLHGLVKQRMMVGTSEEAAWESCQQIFEGALQLFPSLVIDFDQQVLYTADAETTHISFEEHVPPGWKGNTGDVLSYVPEQYQYWVVEETDCV